jgi:Ca-activated chloride channel family protein
VTPPGTRAGHDVSLEVRLDAGVPVTELRSRSHEVVAERSGAGKAVIRLAKKSVIPNKDFLLEYGVAGPQLSDALLTHHDARGGFFTLVLQPPRRVTIEDVTPKELVFVLDTSGSMQGFPIEKAKETMKLALDGLYPRDTFNLITFAGDTHVLFPEPVPATPENLAHAQSFLASRRGAGGTEMMKAIRAALAPSSSREGHVRIVCFMTDGYVGNDMEIIAEIRKHGGARVFSFGIGGSVNRFLLDKMAEEGRGEVTYVGLKDDGSAAARRFHERVRNPLLTDIFVDWGGLEISEVYPQRIQDLFSAKPVILHGRYGRPGSGKITLRGRMSGQPFSHTLSVDLPAKAPQHDALATLWARKRIDHLMSQDWAGVQHRNLAPALREEITRLGLDFRLMTQFTSFVAVEDRIVTEGGEPRRIEVPVEMPEGVSYEGVFGIPGEARMEQVAGIVAATPQAFRQMSKVAADEQEPDKRGYSHQPAGPLPPIRVDTPPTSGGSQTGGDKAAGFRSKFHPDVLKVVGSMQQGSPAVSAPFVSEGKARVEVWLADAAPETIAQVRAAGFETTQESKVAKILIGRIEVGKLEALASLDKVRYIAPHRTLGASAFSPDALEATSPPALLALGRKPEPAGAVTGGSPAEARCGKEVRRILLAALRCAVCSMILPPPCVDTCPHR